MAEAEETFEASLRALRAHDQDVTFRTLFNLISSTLRTNFYRQDRIEHYISLKAVSYTHLTLPTILLV